MVRTGSALLVGALLAVTGAARVADAPAAGNWKVTILNPGESETLWLIQLDEKDGKWTGSVVASAQGLPKSTLELLSVTGDRLRFTVKAGQQVFTFDGKIPKEKTATLKGSIAREGQMVPCELEATTLKELDPFDLNKEFLANHASDPRVFNVVMELLNEASDHKAKPEEVRGWAEKLWKAAEPFGVRFQQEMAARTADILNRQQGYSAVALAYAQRAERLLEPKDPARTKQRVLSSLAQSLEKAGKADEAKEVQARVAKLDKEMKAEQAKVEAHADEEYLKAMPPFKPTTFPGRKAKSDRAVLVELFTGAQCPPCVAADLAFDGLEKTYKPTDVVLLEYHVHVPGPDPLTNLDTMARLDYYGDQVEGTPTLLLNGKSADLGGGGIKESEKLYEQYRKAIEPLLEKSAQATLKVSASRRGDKIEINAEVSGIDKPGEDVRLRFALVEERVRYLGSNGVRFHHRIVRAMPGGEKGLALKDKTTRHAVSVDLKDLSKQLTQYITTIAKKSGAKFPDPETLVELKNLSLVAFIQNDKTKEVLQAVQVDLGGAKE
jgi:thiol-disulfide isomerase/thioredoxin